MLNQQAYLPMPSAPAIGGSARLLMSCESQKYMNEKDES
jgi:hypothetical protein